MSVDRASPPEMSNPDEVRGLARTYQYDRYVSALLLPRRHREGLIVLAAFAGELQRIPFVVNEPMIAAIRLQWWRDELLAAGAPDAAERRSGHGLCDALVAVARESRLPFGLLQGMIDAAETENDPAPFERKDETRQILVKREGALFELAGRLMGAKAEREIWARAAMAYGGARLASEYGWRREIGAQTYVSQDGTDVNEALVGPATKAISAIRTAWPGLDRGSRGALLPLATVEPQLQRFAMQSRQSGATNKPLSDFARVRSILWAHWRGLG